MITQTAWPLRIPTQIFGHKVGVKFRNSLRELGAIHMYRREGKFYTFDIPFQLKWSSVDDKIIVVINKANLPRTYPPQYLIEAKYHIESSIGMPIQILEADDILAICCQVPDGRLRSKE